MEGDNYDAVAIGDNIRILCDRRGWKPAFIAKQMGVSVQAVSQWMNNRTGIKEPNKKKLAALFGLTIDQLEGRRLPNEPDFPNQNPAIQEGDKVDKNASLSALSAMVSILRPELSAESIQGLAAILLDLALNPPARAGQQSYEDQLLALFQGALAARSS